MKLTLPTLIFFLLLSNSVFSQSKKYYKERTTILNQKVDSLISVNKTLDCENSELKRKLSELENKIFEVSSALESNKRIIEEIKTENLALKKDAETRVSNNSGTSSGAAVIQNKTQNANTPESENDDSGQYKSNTETVSPTPSTNSAPGSGSGRTIFTGPRGGRYYLNSNGKKVYIK